MTKSVKRFVTLLTALVPKTNFWSVHVKRMQKIRVNDSSASLRVNRLALL